MLKAYNLLILLIFGLFLLNVGFSASCTTNHKVLYKDSTSFSVDVACTGVVQGNIISYTGCNFVTNKINVNDDNSIKTTPISFTCVFNPKYTSTLILSVFENAEQILPTYSITPKDGNPAFNLFVVGENTGEAVEFDNKENVTLNIKGDFDGQNKFDNIDDGSTSLNCTLVVNGNGTNFTVDDEDANYFYGIVSLGETNPISVTCGTGDNATTKSVNIKRIDIEQKENLFYKIKDFFLKK